MRKCGKDEVNKLWGKQKYTDANERKECTKFVRKIKYLLRAQKARPHLNAGNITAKVVMWKLRET